MEVISRRLSLPLALTRDAENAFFLALPIREARKSLPTHFSEGPVNELKLLPPIQLNKEAREDFVSEIPVNEAEEPVLAASNVPQVHSASSDSAKDDVPDLQQPPKAVEKEVMAVDDDDDDDEDLTIVEVRKLDKPAPSSRPVISRRIKQEPGLESAGGKASLPRKGPKPKKTQRHRGNGHRSSERRSHSPATRIGSPDQHPDQHMGEDTSSSNLSSIPMHDPYNAFAHIEDMVMPTVSPDPSTLPLYAGSVNGMPPPPAYQPKSLEQIVTEANNSLEERIINRMSKDFAKMINAAGANGGSTGFFGGAGGMSAGGYLKRGRATISLDEAEANLKAASAEYAKAKAAEERRANKRVRTGHSKKEEGDDNFGDGSSGMPMSTKGGKGSLSNW